jgi:hypothetical protein|eukprot:COSAG06_NODE_6630_length_2849_cov_1.230545_3_plen_56_part_00
MHASMTICVCDLCSVESRRWDDVDEQMRCTDPRFAVPEDMFSGWGPEVSGLGARL